MSVYCSHGGVVGWCQFDVNRRNVATAFFGIASRYIPLRGGKDTLHVSPEAAQFLPDEVRMSSRVDPRLYGLEMRLQRDCS